MSEEKLTMKEGLVIVFIAVMLLLIMIGIIYGTNIFEGKSCEKVGATFEPGVGCIKKIDGEYVSGKVVEIDGRSRFVRN